MFEEGAQLSFGEVVALWREPPFQGFFVGVLADVPFEAFFWETPPLTTKSLGDPFEAALIRAPQLRGARADPRPFAENMSSVRGAEGIVSFPNLGKDAQLVVPCPRAAPEVYAHLAAFVRGAPEVQRCGLWSHVAAAVEARLGQAPLWLSTAGLGVAWLHVRVDRRPKYYRYGPYRCVPVS